MKNKKCSESEILTYFVMSNHFHVLVESSFEEREAELSNAQLLRRCKAIYEDNELAMMQWETPMQDPEKKEHYRKSCYWQKWEEMCQPT